MDSKLLLVIAVLGGISEALSLIPAIKANGVFQLIQNILKVALGKKE
jgi:hypothetical protein